MTVRVSRRRGQPLLVLIAVMLCWVGARAFLWRAEYGERGIVPRAVALSLPPDQPSLPRSSGLPVQPAGVGRHVWGHWAYESRIAVLSAALFRQGALSLRSTAPPMEPRGVGSQQGSSLSALGTMPRAALQIVDRPPSFLSPFAPSSGRQELRAERRWSADAWMLLRSGGGAASAGPSIATYGASQVGAVLRYRLWPGNPHRLTSYVRVSAALNGSGEREAALGLSVRPIGALPVFVAGEGRVSRLSGGTVVRPAVMAVTELPPIALPKGARAEFYLQGGYVGGLGATPFIDGQLRIDRKLTRVGPAEVRAGGGVWGGAQQGAGRLDLGPAVTLQVAQGPAAMRVGFDWRFRLMGAAAPTSGPALTISAGF